MSEWKNVKDIGLYDPKAPEREPVVIEQWFKPKDFSNFASFPPQMDMKAAIAHLANAKLEEFKKQWLEELLADAPTMYGGERVDGSGNLSFEQDKRDFPWDVTHTAKLVEIKEIGG